MTITALRADDARDRFTYDHITVEPVTPTIGAEIGSVDLSKPIGPELAADIQKALHDWRVVFFRDQHIDNDQLKAFGRAFGPLTPAHPIAEGLEDHPEIWERTVDEYRTRRQRNDALPPGREPPRDYKGWHIDITFVANPNRYSILYGVEIPPYGGDTLFTNLIEAYRGLSPSIQKLIDGLQAVHRTSGYDNEGRKPRRDGRSTGPFVSLHPLVRIHPETGEKLLFLNPGTVSHIVGLKERESQALLDLLFYEATRPEYQVRFHWRPKSLVVWDNQAVAHAGPIDYSHFDLPRAVRRITVAGDLPEGPDGFRSRPLEGDLFNVLG
ncbi:TauD/TfdA family dioxygenase [Sphingomonas sp. JC676]|uniref:TauD/TfdA dioxygenase family protein n=1 Tax=Sphingomonas sp. JC676 TaxID=2768065 RepID=UPI001658241A|nr:TauD/TfdA family dioxygenase [Sphingomonas sp. JC676]MBC9031159.1 TauD/TfdA family dioxygenase [Sphingomonas sp. JC676]